jgi:hypothetical protein
MSNAFLYLKSHLFIECEAKIAGSRAHVIGMAHKTFVKFRQYNGDRHPL